MRLSLRWVWLALAFVTGLLWPGTSSAEDRVTVRGNYYREQSTRVLSPEVRVTVDAPDERLTFGAAYLLDAVSSASIAAGTAEVTGGDQVFTEIRHETTGTIASKVGDWTMGGFFRYSTETDYISRSVGTSVARDFLQKSFNLSFSYAYNFDRVYRISGQQGTRLAYCGGRFGEDCEDGGRGEGSNLLQTHYFAAGYTHALRKTLLSILTVEYAQRGRPHGQPLPRGRAA